MMAKNPFCISTAAAYSAIAVRAISVTSANNRAEEQFDQEMQHFGGGVWRFFSSKIEYFVSFFFGIILQNSEQPRIDAFQLMATAVSWHLFSI
jgi:hypothetical protein